jgi:hypothetical protein
MQFVFLKPDEIEKRRSRKKIDQAGNLKIIYHEHREQSTENCPQRGAFCGACIERRWEPNLTLATGAEARDKSAGAGYKRENNGRVFRRIVAAGLCAQGQGGKEHKSKAKREKNSFHVDRDLVVSILAGPMAC